MVSVFKKFFFIALALSPATPVAFADDAVPLTPVTVECVTSAASLAGVHPAVLIGIMDKEGGRVGGKTQNKNGTFDYGPMQVNTVWLGKLSQFGITKELLMNNGCVNVHIGAWVLAVQIREYGNTWAAVGAYHSRTPFRRDAYAADVIKRLQRLYAQAETKRR